MTDASPLNSEALKEGAFSVKDGELYDPQIIDEGLKRIKRLYEDLGYIDFSYTPQIDINQSKKSVSCSFHLVPGKQYFINRFNISGAKSNEEAAAIGSEISDFEGKIFSPTTFSVLKKRLSDYLDHKEPALKDLQYQRLPGSPGKVDISVHLQARKQ
jgi:outer membrane protein assembly factor BamA